MTLRNIRIHELHGLLPSYVLIFNTVLSGESTLRHFQAYFYETKYCFIITINNLIKHEQESKLMNAALLLKCAYLLKLTVVRV